MTILSSYLPFCILLKMSQHSEIAFLMLPENVFLVFLAKSTLTMYDSSVTRLQILMMLGFTITDYKVQGATFQTIVHNLHKHSKSKDKSLHKKFCFTYIQLSRL